MAFPRLLVFDLDGTLIDSRQDLCNAVNATLRHLGRSPLPDSIIASYIGNGVSMLIRRALNGAQPTQETAMLHAAEQFFLDFYRAHKLDHTYVYSEIFECLTAIRDTYPETLMAVLTNKPVAPSRAICAHLGLDAFFFQNYGGDSFSTKKPDPYGLFALIDEAGERHVGRPAIHVSETVMIGDSEADVLVARNAGTQFIGCAYGFAPDRLSAASPEHTVASPAELLQVLAQF